jgi:hypothetical protein
MSFWDDEKRVPIKTSVKKKVYARAKGKCECCGRALEINQGDFHHTRDPKVSAMAKTVQFLCPTCHRIYGHKRVTRTVSDFWEDKKETKVVRLKAPNLKRKSTKRESSRAKPKSTSTKTRGKTSSKKSSGKTKKKSNTKRKGPSRSRTKSGRWRKKRSDAGKKRK